MLKLLLLILWVLQVNAECPNCTSAPITYQIRFDKPVTIHSHVVKSLEHFTVIIIEDEPITKLFTRNFNLSTHMNGLIIRNCGTTEIEENFLHDQNLEQYLSITENRITTIRRHTFRNLKIRQLSLDQNRIEILEDESFLDLPNLSSIDLERNYLTQINANSFVQLSSLSTFLMNVNFVEELVSSNFNFMQGQWAQISLVINRIKNIDQCAFDGLQSKDTTLLLDENFLTYLPDGIFDDVNFSMINLASNNITSVSENFCRNNCHIKRLDLSMNELSEDSYKFLEEWKDEYDVDLKIDPVKSGSAKIHFDIVFTYLILFMNFDV